MAEKPLFHHYCNYRHRHGGPILSVGPDSWHTVGHMLGIRRFGIGAFLAVAALVSLAAFTGYAQADSIDELRDQLSAKREALKATEEKIRKFQETVAAKRREARTLADQIAIMDDNIAQIELTITQTGEQIEEVDLEIQAVAKEIQVKEEEIAKQKDLLAEYIRALHTFDQQSTVAIFLKYQTFSEAMNEAATIAELQDRAQATLVTIQQLHNELVTKKRELGDFKQSLQALKNRQQAQQDALASSRQGKQHILDLTNAQEAQYSSLLKEAQQAHKAAEAEITRLDAAIREELRRQGIDKLPSVGTFDWPINALFGVSCGFHCDGYPYAYLIGPHSGIDIPTNVGTPIKAPADGYVARLYDSGGRGYSYILLLHGDNISSVYGHVSGFGKVKEGQLITRGTVLGYTGGAPGSHGSGLSTGPHLHFEVRVKNLPVDPQRYL